MEFDRMKTLRMILEADEESPNEEENTNEEETNEEDEAPKKKTPSRFKQDDDDVDTDTSTEDEDGEMDGSDADEDDNSDSDDLSDFGNHGGDELPNNEYDPDEVETLNNLMASEADAMNEYLDAARVSKVDVLQRLYADIANEERFHMEQLLFAKSELTGEKYVPRDKDVRKEYEELLELGMDEDSAMATAVDKVGIKVSVSDNDETDLKEDAKKLQEDVEMLEMMFQQFELASYVYEYANMTNNAELLTEMNLIQESYILEDITPRAGVEKQYTQQWNPFKMLFNLLKTCVNAVTALCKFSAKATLNIKYKLGKTREWIAKHGIGALFGDGVMLYTWNDKKNFIDIDGLCFMCNTTWKLCQMCCIYSKSQNNFLRTVAAKNDPPFLISNQAYNKQYRNPQEIVKTLDSVVIMKTKVVVNDNNKNYLENLFFGQMKGKDVTLNKDKLYNVSKLIEFAGIYATFDYIANRLGDFAKIAEKCVEEMSHLEGEPNGIYHTNVKLYNDIGKWMKVVGNQFGKLIKMVTNDMNNITKIGSGDIPNVLTPEEAAEKQKQQQQQQQPKT